MSLDKETRSLKAGGYHRRPPTGAATDPQTIIANAPKGTRDWKRVLDAVLRVHNKQHAKLIKVVADKTTLDRERFYFKFWDDLRFNTRFADADPRYLTNRQVLAVTRLWADRGLSVATVHNYLSFLRTYAAWIGRPGLVRDVAHYFGEDSHYIHRDRSARADRSWIAKCVDVEAKIADVRAHDPWVGLQLEICYRFGLRAKEARHFRPHEAVKSREEANPRDTVHFPGCERFLRVHRGTKGGRPRDIPLQTPEQVELIDRLLKIVAKGNYVGEPGRTAAQNANRFYNTLRRFGITKAALGVTAHGLRHQHANDRYEELTGEPSPVRGGASEAPNKRSARLAIAHEFGHGRPEVSNAYLGPSLAHTRARQLAAADQAAPEPTAAA